jgi:hypothetical protein
MSEKTFERYGWRSYADGSGNPLILLDVRVTCLNLRARTIINGLHTHTLLTTTKLRRIDGDEESFHAPFLSVVDVFL